MRPAFDKTFVETRRDFLAQSSLVLAGLTAPASVGRAESISRQVDGPLDLGLERSFVLIELRWFGQQMLPVLLVSPPLVPGSGKPKDEWAKLRRCPVPSAPGKGVIPRAGSVGRATVSG